MNRIKMKETIQNLSVDSFLPNVPIVRPTFFQMNMSSYITEVNEKVVSLDEYRRKLKNVDFLRNNCKKGKLVMKKQRKVNKQYSSKFAKANTRRSIANYLFTLNNSNKAIPNPYVEQLIQKENYKAIINHNKNSLSDILPIRHHSNFNRFHYNRNKSLDMIFDDTNKQNSYCRSSLTGNLSDFMVNHAHLSNQLRQLDYDNNKVNSLLKTEKNQIERLVKR